MNQTTARALAKRYQADGIPVIADSLGGWAGGDRAQHWGIRVANVDKVVWLIEPTANDSEALSVGTPDWWRAL